MGLKIVTEKELLAPAEIDTLVKLGACGSLKLSSVQRKRSYHTVKSQLHIVRDKIEGATGRRPYIGNVAIFAIFGRFLTEEEVRYLIESGELHSWRMNVKEATQQEAEQATEETPGIRAQY